MRVAALVRSVNAGALAPVAGLRRPSGIHKQPVDRIEVRDPGPKRGGLGSGVVGDAIYSRKHHGGQTQAVYAVALGAEVLHEPREWPEYHPGYYGAFVRDPDGNNVEAVHHTFE